MLTFNILISQIAGMEIMFFLSVAVACVLYFSNYKKDFYKVLFASSIAMVTTLLTKQYFNIARPENMLVIENGFRFPSGHATMAGVVMTLGIAYSYTHIEQKYIRYAVYFISVMWFMIVGYSRLYLHVHYPIDVIVGGTIGILSTLAILKIFKHFHYYQ
jgi:membrane-associated phospholipid phosphatase